MAKSKVRVRFAPSPTGLMHLGNMRTALINYLFAKQKNGTFVLRIEDTDPERNFDPGAKIIIADLGWLDIQYDEGPQVGGPYEPYFQSERAKIYQEKLDVLVKEKKVYRCFCSQEELTNKRQRQIALKMPPRYDKSCLKLTDQEVQQKLDANMPFIWRMKLNPDEKITIKDLSHGNLTFDLKNFSDFPLTRQNGTFTFMFSNFVDDMVMQISHVLRGEDHLTNTAGQAALYKAFDSQLPIFWHMPILCNLEGKKLSKRDFGFSLKDLHQAGYLPEAICNYLAILGRSFEQEIMTLDELAKALDFDNPHAKGQIKYDTEKLNWINHKWIDRYDPQKLAQLCRPYLEQEYPEVKKIEKEKLAKIIQILKTDLVKLSDIIQTLNFYFKEPTIVKSEIENLLEKEKLLEIGKIIEKNIKTIDNPEQFVANLKNESKQKNIKLKEMFTILRVALIGKSRGPGIRELIEILGTHETKKRIETLINVVK